MAIVVDASVALSWIFADERDAYAIAAARHVESHGGFVPALWRWEVQNSLLSAFRRRRIGEMELAEYALDLQALPIQFESSNLFGAELALAKRHGLSVYDAAYLDVAMRRACKLATKDDGLARAARALGVYFESP